MIPKADLWRRLMVLTLVAIIGGGAATAALLATPEEPVTAAQTATPAAIPVTVQTVPPETHAAVVRAQGEVVPLWESTLRAQVSGRIVYLSDNLQPGRRIAAGELLVSVAKSDYSVQLAEAQSHLAQAALALHQEEREAQAASDNWQRSGLPGEPPSPLALRIPQLTAARAQLAAAKSAVAHAELQLTQTQIRAPYSGVVLDRRVAPGESLFAGDPVVTLYSTAAVEVGLQLDAQQWHRLPEHIDGMTVSLRATDGPGTWKARVVRQARQVNREARLRTLFVRVERPLRQSPPLLPGRFVQAEIMGRPLPDLIAVPEAALTPSGTIWCVGADNRLSAHQLEAQFFEKGRAYLAATADLPLPIRIAVYPNDSYTSGQLTQPLEAP